MAMLLARKSEFPRLLTLAGTSHWRWLLSVYALKRQFQGVPMLGIEVPNPRWLIVRLRPLMELEKLPENQLNTGDCAGAGCLRVSPMVADLSRMPHLLIAGTTGSGKSVCIAAITTCLVMNNTPDDLRLVMIDPKMVELVRFNGLPHLFGKVETDVERILGGAALDGGGDGSAV